jgi:signal transduction histidine kinase
MSVRARVIMAFFTLALPATFLIIYGAFEARQRAMLEGIYASTLERMESGGRELCEADPARFGRHRGHRGARHHHSGHRPHPRVHILAYDSSFESRDPRAPAFDASLREALESGDVFASRTRSGSTLELAMRMPWNEGPCAILVVSRHEPMLVASERAWMRELAVALVVLGAALGVALWALGPPLRRLRKLAEAVRVTPGSFALPKGVGGSDEIGVLASALEEASTKVNEHVERLEARDRALTSYVDATTHDIAIPLTVLQSRLSEIDSNLRENAKIEPNALGAALAECEYLGQLVSNMAAAARIESGQLHLERHEVDLGLVVTRVVARHRIIARQRGISVECAVPSIPSRVWGDEILLERATSNLVHNAIRHGAAKRNEPSAHGHVAVILEPVGTARFRLRVMDDGPNADLERVARGLEGERTNDARNARTRGLGLRIVRAVSDAHEFEISFEKTEEGGLAITLEGNLIAD